MNKHGHLAEFLQACRGRLRLEDVGLRTYGERDPNLLRARLGNSHR
ncbi:hypothetical protein ACWDR3_02555 [Streptomyces sp. NPDC001002]